MKITKPLRQKNGYLCITLTADDIKALGGNINKGDMLIIANPAEVKKEEVKKQT